MTPNNSKFSSPASPLTSDSHEVGSGDGGDPLHDGRRLSRGRAHAGGPGAGHHLLHLQGEEDQGGPEGQGAGHCQEEGIHHQHGHQGSEVK